MKDESIFFKDNVIVAHKVIFLAEAKFNPMEN
jgi:hypothetical protein